MRAISSGRPLIIYNARQNFSTMLLNKRIQLYFIPLLLAAFLFMPEGFVHAGKNKLTGNDVNVSIVQENDGFAVTVKTTKNINVHFYIFTVDGRLVKELTIYGSKRVNISQLEKGIYIYDFFTNDERIKNGKIELH